LKIRHLGSDSPVLHESEIRKRLGIFNFKGPNTGSGRTFGVLNRNWHE